MPTYYCYIDEELPHNPKDFFQTSRMVFATLDWAHDNPVIDGSKDKNMGSEKTSLNNHWAFCKRVIFKFHVQLAEK